MPVWLRVCCQYRYWSIWRANHKTLGAWAERAYPEGHLIDNSDGAAAA